MTAVKNQCPNQSQALLWKIRELARRHRCLLSRLSNAELLADSIALDLARIQRLLEIGELTQLPPGEIDGPPRERGNRNRELRVLAHSGVTTLEIRVRADGLSDVRVDAGKQFSLPPMLADLLSTLAMEGGYSNDGLVAWKTVDEVAILLAKRTNRRISRHAVTQGIYRLRRELFHRGGANPYLIQTNRSRGVRFALKQTTRTNDDD